MRHNTNRSLQNEDVIFMENIKDIAPINEELNVAKYEVENIKSLIYNMRGKQVILDSDIARLYNVETKRVNEAVRRNTKRFPIEFCFQLTEEEINNLRSQFETSSLKKNNYGGRRYLPYAFTEQGIAMLSAVLHSDRAIEVSISIMNAFVEMRRFILNNQMIFEKISTIELNQFEYQKSTDNRFEQVFKYIGEHKEENQKVFFDGQVYDAFSMIIDLIRKSNKEIILIDNYIDIETLNILSKKIANVDVKIYTKQNTPINIKDINKFNTQYPKLEVKYTDKFHDRFLIIDRKYIYHIGASIKDAGKRCFGITLIKYDAIIEDVLLKI